MVMRKGVFAGGPLLVALLWLSVTASVQGAVIARMDDVNLSPPVAQVDSFFDVWIELTEGSTGRLAAYNVGLDENPDSAWITLTGVSVITEGSHYPAAFGSQTPVGQLNAAGADLYAYDNLPGMFDYTQLTSGMGLFRVNFSVAAGTPAGSYPIAFNLGATELSDENGDVLTIQTQGGAINVVPEPASLSLLAFGGMLLLVRRRRA